MPVPKMTRTAFQAFSAFYTEIASIDGYNALAGVFPANVLEGDYQPAHTYMLSFGKSDLVLKQRDEYSRKEATIHRMFHPYEIDHRDPKTLSMLDAIAYLIWSLYPDVHDWTLGEGSGFDMVKRDVSILDVRERILEILQLGSTQYVELTFSRADCVIVRVFGGVPHAHHRLVVRSQAGDRFSRGAPTRHAGNPTPLHIHR